MDWIDDLPPELAAQQALLRGLLALCDADDRIRWLVIGCSLARGAGDRLSDLDMAMGIRDEDFDAARPDLRRAVDGLGELIESYHHQLPSVTQAHERIFAQFADRSQVDLVLFPASVPGGSVPNVVVLYDPDEQLVSRWRQQAGDVRADQGVGVRRLVRAGRSGQVPAPRVHVGGPGQAERGTVPAVATLGRHPGRAGSAVRTDQRPGLRARGASGAFRGHRGGPGSRATAGRGAAGRRIAERGR